LSTHGIPNIYLTVAPGTKAIANETYHIYVLRNSVHRVTAEVTWTDAELKGGLSKIFGFAANSEEIQIFKPPSFNNQNLDKYFTIVAYTRNSSEQLQYRESFFHHYPAMWKIPVAFIIALFVLWWLKILAEGGGGRSSGGKHVGDIYKTGEDSYEIHIKKK
jgi:hypothetical protein